jgi:hypothetical protein
MDHKPIKTVGELIAILSKLDPNLPILTEYDGHTEEFDSCKVRDMDWSFPKKHVLLY